HPRQDRAAVGVELVAVVLLEHGQEVQRRPDRRAQVVRHRRVDGVELRARLVHLAPQGADLGGAREAGGRPGGGAGRQEGDRGEAEAERAGRQGAIEQRRRRAERPAHRGAQETHGRRGGQADADPGEAGPTTPTIDSILKRVHVDCRTFNRRDRRAPTSASSAVLGPLPAAPLRPDGASAGRLSSNRATAPPRRAGTELGSLVLLGGVACRRRRRGGAVHQASTIGARRPFTRAAALFGLAAAALGAMVLLYRLADLPAVEHALGFALRGVRPPTAVALIAAGLAIAALHHAGRDRRVRALALATALALAGLGALGIATASRGDEALVSLPTAAALVPIGVALAVAVRQPGPSLAVQLAAGLAGSIAALVLLGHVYSARACYVLGGLTPARVGSSVGLALLAGALLL